MACTTSQNRKDGAFAYGKHFAIYEERCAMSKLEQATSNMYDDKNGQA